jgi:uncharacterized protein YjbI with pentapeptide repeats
MAIFLFLSFTMGASSMNEEKPAPRRVEWVGADLRNVSFAGQSLKGADLRACDLSGANFTSADVSYADFRGAKMHGTTFENANMYGSKLQGCEAFNANFRGANMQQCNMGGAYLDGALLPPPSPVYKRPLASPSQIAEQKPNGQAQPQGHDNGRGR